MAYLLYVDPQLVQMRNALDQDGIVGLAKCILDLERDFSASPATSRILQEPDYPGNSEMLLAEITPRVLHSIFSNTLPVDALKPGFLPRMAKISLLDQHATTIDPGIYVNFLAAGDGSPMTLSDFEGFLDALDATIHNLRTADGTDISSEVNAYYRRIFRRGDLIDANMRSADFENSGALFLQRNRERLQDAQRQGASHITIPGECGWSRNIHARCKDHRTLQSSPAIFRVANCVLRVLYPTEHYQMHHFCLFKIFRSEQAGIGESMGHHLVLSYGNYGGFNFKQAGISVGAAMDMDFKAWLGVCDRGVDILGEIKVMLAAERAKVLAELQLEEAKKDLADKFARKQEMSRQLDAKKFELEMEKTTEVAQMEVDQKALRDMISAAEEKKRKTFKKIAKLRVSFDRVSKFLGLAYEEDTESSHGSSGDGAQVDRQA